MHTRPDTWLHFKGQTHGGEEGGEGGMGWGTSSLVQSSSSNTDVVVNAKKKTHDVTALTGTDEAASPPYLEAVLIFNVFHFLLL